MLFGHVVSSSSSPACGPRGPALVVVVSPWSTTRTRPDAAPRKTGSSSNGWSRDASSRVRFARGTAPCGNA
ncbi:hypothetical protein OPV22_028493 [Ensete ventricosum]|uniref:Uncharacterized protein n=1 Tax=Ensete ventricosum TaxID=4639 RepID=A0AAV8Q0K3_ENSVE|nr:hypothetical protein OPV22_028493 [Ensete ventricosum]